jgi:hypothetical protein
LACQLSHAKREREETHMKTRAAVAFEAKQPL